MINIYLLYSCAYRSQRCLLVMCSSTRCFTKGCLLSWPLPRRVRTSGCTPKALTRRRRERHCLTSPLMLWMMKSRTRPMFSVRIGHSSPTSTPRRAISQVDHSSQLCRRRWRPPEISYTALSLVPVTTTAISTKLMSRRWRRADCWDLPIATCLCSISIWLQRAHTRMKRWGDLSPLPSIWCWCKCLVSVVILRVVRSRAKGEEGKRTRGPKQVIRALEGATDKLVGLFVPVLGQLSAVSCVVLYIISISFFLTFYLLLPRMMSSY